MLANNLLIKVCGMLHPSNILEISRCNIDAMGFIFYHKSPRNIIGRNLDKTLLQTLGAKKVGVFVDATIDFIKEMDQTYSFDLIQLHGTESPAYCKDLLPHFQIIKAFGIRDIMENKILLDEYRECVNYFLFDTGRQGEGGTGQHFEWNLLHNINIGHPFFISGGIKPEMIEKIKQFNHPYFVGIDLNSGFEKEPGLKDFITIDKFINNVRNR